MKTILRRIACVLLSCLVMLPVVPVMGINAYAQSDYVGIEQISCGSSHTAILKKDGSLWMTGSNTSGQFGNGTTGSSILCFFFCLECEQHNSRIVLLPETIRSEVGNGLV